MITFPNAKINLGLRILRLRPDGYHDLETIFLPIALRDVLEIGPRAETAIEVEQIQAIGRGVRYYNNKGGDIFFARGLAVDGAPEGNTVLRVVQLLREEGYQIPPLRIELFKAIPFGAGLGGGSADATFALQMLDERFQFRIDKSRKAKLLRQIGADCPFFLHNKPMLATGTGEQLAPFSLSPEVLQLHITIVKPPFGISTAEAYQNVSKHPEAEGRLTTLLAEPVQNWRHTIVNDFETHLFHLYPQLSKLKALLYSHGAIYAAMSGSGSAIFALSRKPLELPKTKEEEASLKGCFLWEGNILMPKK